MSLRASRRLAPLWAALVISAPTPAQAQAASFEGSGQAPVVGGDRVRARARALDEAFRVAVNAAAASLLEPAVLAQRQSALKLTVEPKARTYVTSYRVLEEGEQGGVFRLRVAAELALDRIERDLGGRAGGEAAAAGDKAPRIGSCLVDRTATRGSEAGAVDGPGAGAEAWDSLLRTLGGERLQLVALPAACAATADPRALRDARLDGALTGELTARPSGPVRGTSLVSAHAELKLVLVDAGGRTTATASVTGDGYGAGPAEALRSAARAAFEGALDPMLQSVRARWPRPAPLTLLVPHLERWVDVGALTRALGGNASGVTVEPSRVGKGSVELTVRGMDAAQVLAALSRPAASPTAPRFVARGLDAHTIAVEVVPPPPPPPVNLSPGAAPSPSSVPSPAAVP